MLHLSMGLVISKYCIIVSSIPLVLLLFYSSIHPDLRKVYCTTWAKEGYVGFTITLLLISTEGREKRTIDMAGAPKPFSGDGGKARGREAPSLKEVCFHFNRSILSSPCPFIQILGRQAQISDALCL